MQPGDGSIGFGTNQQGAPTRIGPAHEWLNQFGVGQRADFALELDGQSFAGIQNPVEFTAIHDRELANRLARMIDIRSKAFTGRLVHVNRKLPMGNSPIAALSGRH